MSDTHFSIVWWCLHVYRSKKKTGSGQAAILKWLIGPNFELGLVFSENNLWTKFEENPSIFVTCTAFTSFMQKMARRPFWKSQSDPISNLSWFFSGNNLWTKFDKNPRIFVTCRAFTPKTGSGKAAILEVAICANIELGQAFMGMNLYTKFENYMYPRRMCDTRTIHGKVINLVN